MKKNENGKKKCFVICPIGEDNSEIRHRSDLILTYIIKPIAEERGYIVSRSDEDSKPGTITSQIIEHLISDELVVADLSFGNPNVYYELAVRHMVRKPVVQIIHVNHPIHFDIITQRTIGFDYQDLESVDKCKKELGKQIQSVEKDAMDVDSPISIAIDTKGLQGSDNPLISLVTRLLSSVQNMQQQIDRISSYRSPTWSRPAQASVSVAGVPWSIPLTPATASTEGVTWADVAEPAVSVPGVSWAPREPISTIYERPNTVFKTRDIIPKHISSGSQSTSKKKKKKRYSTL